MNSLLAAFLVLSLRGSVSARDAATAPDPRSSRPLRSASVASSSEAAAALCDASFPLLVLEQPSSSASSSSSSSSFAHYRTRKLLFANPDDASGRSYAPACVDENDGSRRLDLRNAMMCNSGSCYNEFYQACTFECTWSPPTGLITGTPTSSPTRLTYSTNHVLLRLQDLADGYKMSESVRQSIIDFVNALIAEHLGYGLDVQSIDYPGQLPGEPQSLPLEMVAEGPSDVSDFALSYIMEMLRDKEYDLVRYMEKLAGGAPFKDVSLEVDTYDPGLIMGPSDSPTSAPTRAPITAVAEEVLEEEAAAIVAMQADEEEEPEAGIPWWVWLIVALVLLCLILCCLWWLCTKNDDDEEEEDDKNQTVNIYMKNGERQSQGPRDVTVTKSRSAVRRGSSFGDASRYTTRTSRTRKSQASQGTRRTTKKRSSKPRSTLVSHSFTQKHLPENQQLVKTSTNEDDNNEESLIGVDAVSVWNPNEGFDPDGAKIDPSMYNEPTAPRIANSRNNAASAVPDPSVQEPNPYLSTAVVPYHAPVIKQDSGGSNEDQNSSGSGDNGKRQHISGSGDNVKRRQPRDPTMYIPEDNVTASGGNGKKYIPKNNGSGRGGGGGGGTTNGNTKQRVARDPTMYIPGQDADFEEQRVSRDPTFYVPGQDDSEEPDGVKAASDGTATSKHASNRRKNKNRSSTDASRDSYGDRFKSSIKWKHETSMINMSEDPSVFNPNTREPEAPTSDEVEDYNNNHNNKKKSKKKSKKSSSKKKSSSSSSSRRSSRGMVDRMKNSLNWKRDDLPDIDFEVDASAYDSPSILTNHNDANDNTNDGSNSNNNNYGQRDPNQRNNSMFSGGVESVESLDV